ncbi:MULTISPECIES: hypothetical protein [unclassified Pseudomonas]|nr:MULTISPECIES: hypothetical protein [unclassified Pseudomonas]
MNAVEKLNGKLAVNRYSLPTQETNPEQKAARGVVLVKPVGGLPL